MFFKKPECGPYNGLFGTTTHFFIIPSASTQTLGPLTSQSSRKMKLRKNYKQFLCLRLMKYQYNTISHSYYGKMMNIEFETDHHNYPKVCIVKLFTRMRIFYTRKFANREFKKSKTVKQSKTKKQRKISILSNL